MRLLTIALITVSSLMAVDFSTRYDVEVGMLGKVGYADLSLREDARQYEIKLTAKTTGTAARLTAHRSETFISKGHIIEGSYIPDSFIKIKTTNDSERIQSYHFDHKQKKVRLTEETNKLVTRNSFDPILLKQVKKEVKESTTVTSILPTYNQNDLLSSYLNTKKSCNADTKEYTLLAVGARNDKKDITLSFLDGQRKENVAASFSKDVTDIYKLHVQPLKKEDKVIDVLIAFDDGGHMKEALLGDIFWIGKVKATRVYHQVSSL